METRRKVFSQAQSGWLSILLFREQWFVLHIHKLYKLRACMTGTPCFFWGIGMDWLFSKNSHVRIRRSEGLVPCHFHFDWLTILHQQLIVSNRVILPGSIAMITYILNQYSQGFVEDLQGSINKSSRLLHFLRFIWVCLKMLCTPLYPMVLLIIIPIKWLFHWGYTPFSDIPIWIYLLIRHHRLMSETVVTHWQLLNYDFWSKLTTGQPRITMMWFKPFKHHYYQQSFDTA